MHLITAVCERKIKLIFYLNSFQLRKKKADKKLLKFIWDFLSLSLPCSLSFTSYVCFNVFRFKHNSFSFSSFRWTAVNIFFMASLKWSCLSSYSFSDWMSTTSLLIITHIGSLMKDDFCFLFYPIYFSLSLFFWEGRRRGNMQAYYKHTHNMSKISVGCRKKVGDFGLVTESSLLYRLYNFDPFQPPSSSFFFHGHTLYTFLLPFYHTHIKMYT